MLVFDAVICNVDRHFGNFGFLIDNHTNQIAAAAPLFDHGNAFFNFAGTDCWEDVEELDTHIDTLTSSVYDDFIGTTKRVRGPEHRKMLRKLVDFRFRKHLRYNLPPKRLRMIEMQIQKRARLLLEP